MKLSVIMPVYNGEEYIKHFYDILPAFKDKRYIKLNDKPVFILYALQSIKRVNDMLKYWNQLAVEAGFQGVYTISVNRGTIYDKDGNALAQNVSSYKIIAYLSPERSKNSSTPKHVVDVEFTANALSPLLNTDASVLKGYLSKSAYQVELGVGGKDLSEIQKEEIENLNLQK